MIQVSQNGAIQEIMDKEQMEQGLMSELSVRFHQASTTPFASLPLLRLIGNLGISAHSRHILEGTYGQKNLFPICNLSLKLSPYKDSFHYHYPKTIIRKDGKK